MCHTSLFILSSFSHREDNHRSQGSPCCICYKKRGPGMGFSPSTFVLSCHLFFHTDSSVSSSTQTVSLRSVQSAVPHRQSHCVLFSQQFHTDSLTMYCPVSSSTQTVSLCTVQSAVPHIQSHYVLYRSAAFRVSPTERFHAFRVFAKINCNVYLHPLFVAMTALRVLRGTIRNCSPETQ
jgi:hypothetical protein